MDEDGSSMPPPSQPPPALPAPTNTTTKASGGKVTKESGNNLNLGMAQIIVTAATPMVEDGSDKSFPPIGERGSDDVNEKEAGDDSRESGSQGNAKVTSASAKDEKVTKTGAGEAKQMDKTKIIEGRQQVMEAPSVTITLTSPTPNPEDLPSSDQDSSEVQPLEEAEDPFNEKASAAAAADASAGFEANFEANFDANFDDAFASRGGGGGGGPQSMDESKQEDVDVGAPKQVVGGRASIPEELDSNQLERLQNLKESNA